MEKLKRIKTEFVESPLIPDLFFDLEEFLRFFGAQSELDFINLLIIKPVVKTSLKVW